MPTYEYLCTKCDTIVDIFHSMSARKKQRCEMCNTVMEKQIGAGYCATTGFKPTLAEMRETDHSNRVKDPERAVKRRKKHFGHDAVGDPKMESDPRHIVRGRTLGGQEKEVDKRELIKALAKDDFAVAQAQKALKKQK